ncbi:MAG: hypothetical protein DRG39_03825 [Deltaproteobacteria bacterium]|nr:MAG: hypothetical protein DRG39_03825 [Deltaproteobacteria bacterium]
MVQEEDILERMAQEIIEENPETVQKIKAGRLEAVNFLVGQAMKRTKGQANAKLMRRIFMQKLS